MALKFDCCFPYRPNYVPPICCCCWICRQHIPEKMKLAGSMTQTHTRVCDVDIIRKKKKEKNQQQRPIYNWDRRQELWHLTVLCIREGFLMGRCGGVLLPKNLLLHNGSIGSPATFYKTKTATRRRHKRKKIFPNQSGGDDGSQAKRKEEQQQREWVGKLSTARDFSRKKVGIFIFFFFCYFFFTSR